MKAFNIVLFILLFITTCKAQEQRFVPGLKVGISTSQVEGDSYTGFHKAGILGGAMLAANVNTKWSVQFEVIYIQKGSKTVNHSAGVDTGFYFLQLNYLEVPLLAQYHLNKFTFEVGPSFGYLINYGEASGYMDITGERPFKNTETSLSVGIACKLWKNFSIHWRYTNSLLSIRDFATGGTNWDNAGERNNVLAFSLTYQFAKQNNE